MAGVGGAGMWSLAMLLAKQGHTVSGSDEVLGAHTEILKKHGIRVSSRQTDFGDLDVMVYTLALLEQDPARVWAREHNVRLISYPEALGELFDARDGIGVAGTHGKSTTTGLMAAMLNHIGCDPTVIVGGRTLDGIQGFRAGKGEYFVAEACEYRRSFLNLHPRYIVITSLEPDHMDFYQDVEDLKDAFTRFVRGMKSNGRVIYYPDAVDLDILNEVPSLTYGWHNKLDWWAEDVTPSDAGISYTVRSKTGANCRVQLAVPGRHNVLNSLGAFALGECLGMVPEDVASGVGAFCGVARRFERLGETGGVTFVDDYAHHPTELAATFETARTVFAGKRLRVVFQPHQHERTRRFFNDFARVLTLQENEDLLLLRIYGARETEEVRNSVSHHDLAEAIRKQGGQVRAVDTLDEAVDLLAQEIGPNDVVMTIGAGDVWQVAERLLHGV